MEIVEYDIVSSDNCSKLRDYVNRYIKNGWVPHGGVSIGVHENRDKIYLQAIVKYKK